MSLKKKIFVVYAPLGLAIAMAGFVVGLLVMDWIIMPMVVGKHRGHAIVPNMVGLTEREVAPLIKDAGLKMEKDGEEYSDLILEGRIASQRIPAGKEVKKGRTIQYLVSNGPEIVTIPELRGRTMRQARYTLKSLGLEPGKIRYAYDESLAVDFVISSTPESGTPIVRESAVDLMISKGSEPTESHVPNLVGFPLTQALKHIAKAGLVAGEISYVLRYGLAPKTVVSQSLTPGSRAPRGSAVDLVASSRK